MQVLKTFLIVSALMCGSCAFEWDVPAVPQRIHGKTEKRYVYWPPRHQMPPMKIVANPAPTSRPNQ